jgi:hypothetical protein
MKKDKVYELKKEIRTYYLKKCFRILASIVLVSVCIFFALWFWYGILKSGYISEKTNTLYIATGKCSNVSYHEASTIRRGVSYYTFYIDDIEFRLYSKKITNYPESDTLENVLKNSEVTLQYVTSTSGVNNIQSLQLSDGTIISDFEYVKKENTINFIFACIMAPLFLLMTLPLLCWGCYGWIHSINHKIENRIPVIKRRLNRMAEREKMFSDQDSQ